MTFGTAPPPGPLYTGPTDRPIIRRMIAAGEPVTACPGHGAPGESDAGPGVEGSANVQRGTCRITFRHEVRHRGSGRASVGSLSKNRRRSIAGSLAVAYRSPGAFAKHFRQTVSRSRGTPRASTPGDTGSAERT